MQILEVDAFESYTDSDLTEGRGHKVHIGYFTRESDAVKASQGAGVMGNNAPVAQVKLRVCVYDSYEEFVQDKENIERKEILARLTPRQRKLLGVE